MITEADLNVRIGGLGKTARRTGTPESRVLKRKRERGGTAEKDYGTLASPMNPLHGAYELGMTISL